MTKFIPVAFALVAFGASLSPAFADGDRVVPDATLVNTYVSAPATSGTQNVGTYHYSDAEKAIINQGARQR
jgi:hypothetical protein